MNNFFKLCLALIFFSLNVSGCVSSHSSARDQITPLKTGNMFISKKDYFDIRNGEHYLTKIDTIRITGTKVIGTDTFYVTNSNQYVINRQDGYWSEKGKVQEAKYPGEIGDTFFSYKKITNEKPPDTVISMWKIIAKDQRVTVSAGTFVCYEYERNSMGNSGRLHLRNFAWWSPGHGIVKEEDYYPTDQGKLVLIGRQELIEEILK